MNPRSLASPKSISQPLAAWLMLIAGTTALARQDASPAPPGASELAPEPEAELPQGQIVTDDRPLTEDDMRRLARDAIARLSLARLREVEEPTVEDYRISALGIRIARRLDPKDAELCRLELEAWDAAGDDRESLKIVGELVKLDPADTVAQLRLVTMRIRSMQTVEDRLAAYVRMLGPAGQALDPSVRSRLALDAALLSRESGDEDRFVEYLTQATTLDVTNKEAAALHATYFLGRTTDGRERVDLLANLLLADPGDRQVYLQLIDELFQRGAFKAAKRFHDRAADLRDAARDRPSVPEVFQRNLLICLTDGPDACLREVQKVEDKLLSDVLFKNNAMRDAGRDPGEDPAFFPIPAPLEMLRMAIAYGRGDAATLEEHARRVVQRHKIETDEMQRPPEVGVEPTPEDKVREYERRVRLSRITARLWAGMELDEAQADIDALLQDKEEVLSPDAIARIKGWMLIRRGDTEGAKALLEPLAPADAIALMGLALLAEQAGDQRAALSRYARLALDHPQTAAGAAARIRVETLVGQSVRPTEEARALDEWSTGFAPWLDGVTRFGNSYMGLAAVHATNRIGPLDRPVLRVTLRNNSRQPMALGPNQPINSRLLCTPRMTANNEDMTRITQPEVLNLGRRLRLMPGEELTQDVWVSRGRLGVWMDVFSTSTLTLRWRIMQGFEVTLKNTFEPGVLTLTAVSDLLTRDPLAAAEDIETVLPPLAEAQGRAFYHAVLRGLANATFRGTGEGDLTGRRQRLADVFAKRLASAPDVTRVYVLPLLVRGGVLTVDTAPLDTCRDDPSPLVKAIMLMIGFPDQDDPYPRKMTEDTDPDIRRMAIDTVTLVDRSAKAAGTAGDMKMPSLPPGAPAPAKPAETVPPVGGAKQ
jgi:tetratricopeptide (TPR) repeat protein